MKGQPVLLAAGRAAIAPIAAALEDAGFDVRRLDPAEARPDRVRSLGPRLLVLESPAPLSLAAIQEFWDGAPMEDHLPILLLEPPRAAAFSLSELDEPVDRAAVPCDPREIVARVEGLFREKLIRIFRRSFHEISQPLTIARAYSRRAMSLVSPGDAVQPTIAELDRQVERLFRIAEDLQRRRME
jgi:hypothetical protein